MIFLQKSHYARVCAASGGAPRLRGRGIKIVAYGLESLYRLRAGQGWFFRLLFPLNGTARQKNGGLVGFPLKLHSKM